MNCRHLTSWAVLACAVFISFAAHAEVLTVEAGQSIQAAVTKAKAGDTIRVMPGTYRETVFIDKENITLQGVIVDGKWPVMDGGGKLNDGILASGHGVVIQRFWVKGYKGNGIMTQGANNYKILDNYVDGGFYGIFPQFGKNGLVARNRITRVEDAGIYVGMSDNVDVVANETWGNVMGIESENCRDVLMEGNYVWGNATGMVAILIPGLPVKDAARTIIRNNFIIDNNGKNFAPASSAAANVPVGVGVLLVGVKDSTVEGNIIRGNHSAAVVTSDHATFGMPADPKLDPFPANLAILDNHMLDNGNKPDKAMQVVLKTAGVKRADIFATGKERDSCISNSKSLATIGTKRWKECEPGRTTAALRTAMLAEPVKSPPLTAEQKGRLTYLAVCTGCHAYNTQLHGPSMMAIKAIYQNNPDGLAQYAANPQRKRRDFAEMPKQDYLGTEVLKSVANYILTELQN